MAGAGVDRHVDLLRNGPAVPVDAPLGHMQASRWDWMKDMAGVMCGVRESVDPLIILSSTAGPAGEGSRRRSRRLRMSTVTA